MAVTNFSPLLGLALPTTGDLQGTWGATVNDSITQLLDSAVAGTTTLSVDADVILSTTNGAANQARSAIILWTASNGATTRNITAPAQSKAYLVINSGTGSIVIRGSGPTTGVTVPASARALVAWNGSDFVKIVSNPVSLTTDVTGTLPIANGGTGTTSTTFANLTTNVTGLLPVANGGTGTATPALVQGSNITITGSWPNQTIAAAGAAQVYPGAGIANSTGSAWGTSYTTTGSGTVVALATSPTFVTPVLGTPSSGTLSACTVDGTNAVGYKAIPQSGIAKTTSYTLATGDIGEFIEVGSGGSIVVPNATFAAGDAVVIFNNTSGSITLTMTITTAYIGGTDSDKATISLATRGICNVLFISGTVCVVTGNVS
jgi:hypothetical protein